MSIKIETCNEPTCINQYQDDKYGKNKRVMNSTTKGWRCTVCGKDKN